MFNFRLPIAILITLLVVFPCRPVQAVAIDEVSKDFTPISGYVIMEEAGEYLIDLDGEKGISVGDLFSVIKPGKKITHPVTGKVLGALEEVKGILKATRLQSGYSFARPLGKVAKIKRGDQIRRYANMSAALWDYTGRGETLFFDLRQRLPELKWEDYQTSQRTKPEQGKAAAPGGPNLIFILTDSGLEVRDSEFQIIHSYPSPQLSAAPLAAAALASNAAPPKPQPAGEITYAPTYFGYQALGEFPRLTLMADFVRDEGRLLMATTDGKEVRVHVVSDKLPVVAEGKTTGGGDILSVRWWRPAPGAALYLAVTSMNNERLVSAILRLKSDGLKPIKEWIPFFFGSFDRDGDGSPETLLRQSFDRDSFWGSQIREVSLVKGKLKVSKPRFKLPRRFTVLGSTFADITGNGQAEAIFVRDKSLYIYAGTKELYQSSATIGGSLSMVTYELDPDVSFSNVITAIVEISPVAVDLDGDGRLEVLAVASDRGIVKTPRLSLYKSWLAVIKYQNGEFVKGKLGEVLDNPTQGLTADGERVLVVASRPGTLLGKKARSRVLVYPLAK